MATTKTIELRTAIPGPRSKEILERKDRVIADPLSIFLPVVIDRGEGARLTDVDGNTFIDFTGGVGCLNVGHAHPRVVDAVQEQAAKFLHTDFTIVPYETYVTLGERLIGTVPISGPAKAAFFNAGTEAVENAIKFARAYTNRPAVIGFEGGFHGRTLLSLSLTSKTHPYKAGLGPFAPEVYRLPYAQDYRGPSAGEALAALERAFVTTVAAETVAAIVMEPVQGEGGFVVAPPEFVEGGDSAIGGTYVGNPVAQAAALAVLDVFEDESLVERAGQIGETIRSRMQAWQERWDVIGDVRGLGAMLAIELVHDRDSKDPAPELASAVVEAASERGLLLLKSGIYSNCIRVLVPLVISESELGEALGVWEDALGSVLGA